MAKVNYPLVAWNRGIISPLALARTDLKDIGFHAETQTNFLPRVLGSMMLRPGWGYIDDTYNDAQAVHLPFVFNNDDTAIIELTDSTLRVRVNEEVITRPSVSTTITNGTFSGSLTGWTDADQPGATSAWVSGNYMGLTGTLANAAIRKQTVTVATGDRGVEHALRVVVQRGVVTLRVGSADGADDYIAAVDLTSGTYSLAFTPTGDFHLQFSSLTDYQSLLQSVTVEGAGVVTLPVPYSADDLYNIRYDQSGDVVFLACSGRQQRRIGRYVSTDSRSWGINLYQPDDGPFLTQNLTQISLTPSAISGNITLTASQGLFYNAHVGALFSLTSTGQLVNAAIAGENQWSDPIRVTGIGSSRTFNITISGTWSGTVALQYSVGSVGSWVNIDTWVANTTTTHSDGWDNQIIYYRIGINTGDYTSGTANVSLFFGAGSITGIARVTAYGSATSVSASVLSHLGGTSATTNWAQGAWSSQQGFPTAVAFFDGRLWWAGKDKIWGSVSDAFDSFDETTVGDSAPIIRSIGSGPVDDINWILPLLRMVLGGQAAEHSVRSTAFDDPLTPTNFSIKSPSSRGSSNVNPVKMDISGMFVDRSGSRLIQLDMGMQGSYYAYDYQGTDASILCPDVLKPSVVRLAIQRMPDTRIHCVRSDGTVAILIRDPAENVKCWCLAETTGAVEDVLVMPPASGSYEDTVYYVVRRTINGATKRFLEKWALESECVGGTLNKQADAFILYQGGATRIITGLSPLEGEFVVCWADGVYQGTYTVSGGQITLPSVVSNAVVGLAYTAQYKSSKLAYAAQAGTALTQKKQVTHLSVIAQNMHYQALKYGKDFNTLRSMPLVEDGKPVAANTVWSSYDKSEFAFGGDWDSDSRLCLQVTAPLPCTLLAAVVGLQTNESV